MLFDAESSHINAPVLSELLKNAGFVSGHRFSDAVSTEESLSPSGAAAGLFLIGRG